MENKCLKFVEGLGINDFKASPCCISATLKRNNKVAIDFPVESNYMTYEDMEIIMLSWCKYFYINIKEVYTPTECVYNAEKLVSIIRSSQIMRILTKQTKMIILV